MGAGQSHHAAHAWIHALRDAFDDEFVRRTEPSLPSAQQGRPATAG